MAPTSPAPPSALVSTTVHLVDQSRPTVSRGRTVAGNRALTTRLWYPTEGGPWPLVVFAHGFQVGPQPYARLCQAWAAAGYVVAAPEFPLTDASIAGAALDETDLEHEPGDIRFVISALLDPAGPTAGRIDPGRVAVAGHSDGGEVALAVGYLPGQSDPRVRAVIALSVQPLRPPGSRGAVPLLVAQGDRDTINPAPLGQAVFEAAGRPRWLLRLLGAGHLAPFGGGTVWQPVVERVTVDFLDRYVSGRSNSDQALATDGQRPGLATITGDP